MGLERKIIEFLGLLGPSAIAEEEEGSDECKADEKKYDQCDDEVHHCWGDDRSGSGGSARAVSDDESGDYCHGGQRSVWAWKAIGKERMRYWTIVMIVVEPCCSIPRSWGQRRSRVLC